MPEQALAWASEILYKTYIEYIWDLFYQVSAPEI